MHEAADTNSFAPTAMWLGARAEGNYTDYCCFLMGGINAALYRRFLLFLMGGTNAALHGRLLDVQLFDGMSRIHSPLYS